MSQDEDDTQNFMDSSEDEKSVISSDSSVKSEIITDVDSSKSTSPVDNNRSDDKGQCESDNLKTISLSVDLHSSNPQKSLKPIEEPCLSTKAVQLANIHQPAKIPGTLTKRRFPFSNKDSLSNTDSKKSTIPSSAKQFKIKTSTESNITLKPRGITPEKFEKELTKTADVKNKNHQHSAQRTELYSQNPATQSIQRQIDARKLVSETEKQVDIHKESRTSESAIKPGILPLDDNSKSRPEPEKHVSSGKQYEKVERDATITSTSDLKVPPPRIFISLEYFKTEFSKVFNEFKKENFQLPAQQPRFVSHKPCSSQSTQTQMECPSSSSDVRNQGTSSIPKRSDITSKSVKKPKKDSTVTTTELNLPFSEASFSHDRFARQLTGISQSSTQQPVKVTKSTTSQCTQREREVPSLGDSVKHAQHQEENFFGSTTQRGLVFDEESKSQSSSEIISTSAEKEYASVSTTGDSNISLPHVLFSPDRFAREFARISREWMNEENFQISSQHSEFDFKKPISKSPRKSVTDPRLSKQSEVRIEENTSKTSQKRRLSPGESSGSQQDFKKHIASTRPVAKVEEFAKTTSSQSQLPYFYEVFSPERFGLEFAKDTGVMNKQNTPHSSQSSDLQNKDPRLRNVIWNPFLTVRPENAPIDTSSKSLSDPEKGPSHSQSDIENRTVECPTVNTETQSEPQTGEMNFLEMTSRIESQDKENRENRTLEIATRLSVLAGSYQAFGSLLNAMASNTVKPPSNLTKSHNLRERRDLARRYHRETIAERQLFLRHQTAIEILHEFVTEMMNIFSYIIYELSVCSYDSVMFKEKVESIITRFRRCFCEEGAKSKDKCYNASVISNVETDRKKTDEQFDEEDENDRKIEILYYKEFHKILSKYSNDVEELFKGL